MTLCHLSLNCWPPFFLLSDFPPPSCSLILDSYTPPNNGSSRLKKWTWITNAWHLTCVSFTTCLHIIFMVYYYILKGQGGHWMRVLPQNWKLEIMCDVNHNRRHLRTVTYVERSANILATWRNRNRCWHHNVRFVFWTYILKARYRNCSGSCLPVFQSFLSFSNYWSLCLWMWYTKMACKICDVCPDMGVGYYAVISGSQWRVLEKQSME
jgi:hypothetical protein